MRKILKNTVRWFKGKSFKGLFMRLTVTFCIVYIVSITERSLKICETMQISPAAVYGTAVGFFGAELVMLLVKKLYTKDKTSPEDTEKKNVGKKIENGKPLPLP